MLQRVCTPNSFISDPIRSCSQKAMDEVMVPLYDNMSFGGKTSHRAILVSDGMKLERK